MPAPTSARLKDQQVSVVCQDPEDDGAHQAVDVHCIIAAGRDGVGLEGIGHQNAAVLALIATNMNRNVELM